MFTLITYDIASQRRLNKVARVCENYGVRVQHSIFESNCNMTKLKELKLRLSSIINTNEDSVRFYNLAKKEKNIEVIGKTETVELDNTEFII